MRVSLWSLLAVFLSSAVAAMGLGGGTVLLLYLSWFSALGQQQMQAMNLLLFLPAAALSLYLHRKNGLICSSVLPPCICGGVLGGIAGSLLSNRLSPDLTRRAFAVFLLVIGLHELWLSAGSIFKKFRHRA
jgi:uncharacterized membrane protein YfcA